MKIITSTFSSLTFGEAKSYKNMTMQPLLTEVEVSVPDYIILDQALSTGTANVREVTESGSVPELLFENKGDKAVLLLDGEELVGAKQNRILNLSILVAANSTITVPVSCVEAGRWSKRSSEFYSEDRAYFSAGRAKKAGHVSESLKMSGTRHSRQGEVWDEIAQKSERMDSLSDTDAMSSLFEGHSEELSRFYENLQPVDHQCGAVFFINNKVKGIDLFDFPETFKSLSSKLVRSYAIDAIDEQVLHRDVQPHSAESFIAEITTASTEEYEAIGEGIDLRLSGEKITGGAIVARNRIIHICAFPVDSEGNKDTSSGRNNLSRASHRRNHYVRH